MIKHLENLPSNIVGFKATGEITATDFTETVLPKVMELIEKTDKLNYLLVLETSVKNFTIGAWMKDVITGIKHLIKWNRAAIVSDSEGLGVLQISSVILYLGSLEGLSTKICKKQLIGCRRNENFG